MRLTPHARTPHMVLLALLVAGSCCAQTVAQQPPRAAVAALSREVALSFFGNDVSWRNEAVGTLTETRPEGEIVLTGAQSAVWVHLGTFLHHRGRPGQPHAPDIRFGGGRPPGPLTPSQRWRASMASTGAPVPWCVEEQQSVDSAFNVEAQQPYAIKVDGVERQVQVLPVVEQGTWTRCYTGKRSTRLLFAPELGTVVAIEHLSYNPQGRVHESSFRLRLTELRSAEPVAR